MNTTSITNQQKTLAQLIQSSSSMSDAEKQGWTTMLQAMNEQQMNELRGILETEKQKLAEIDKKYTKEMKSVERDYIAKYLKSGSRKAWEEQKGVEKEQRDRSAKEAENLLQQL